MSFVFVFVTLLTGKKQKQKNKNKNKKQDLTSRPKKGDKQLIPCMVSAIVPVFTPQNQTLTDNRPFSLGARDVRKNELPFGPVGGVRPVS